MKILITGSNGMLGSELCRKLCSENFKVYATSRCEDRNEGLSIYLNYHFRQLDITIENDVEEILNQINPDVIIHAAASTQVDDCELHKSNCLRNNVDGTRHLIKHAENLNCRFIYISTDFVFSGEKGPYNETDIPQPVNFYGQSKLLAEELVMQSDLPWTIVRTVLLYGKTRDSNRTNFIYWVKNELTNGKEIKVVTDQIRTPTFIEDLTGGIFNLVNSSLEGLFHISGDETVSPFEFAIKIGDTLGLDNNLIIPVNADTFTQVGKRPLVTGFDITKAKKTLGFKPTSIEKALRKIFLDQENP